MTSAAGRSPVKREGNGVSPVLLTFDLGFCRAPRTNPGRLPNKWQVPCGHPPAQTAAGRLAPPKAFAVLPLAFRPRCC